MRKYFSMKFALPAVVLLVVASAITFSAISRANRARVAPLSSSTKDPRSLRGKAKLGHGKFIGALDFNNAAKEGGLDKMVAHSEAILVGTAKRNVCELSEDGREIRTFYRVKVGEVIKGKLKTGDNIILRLPGGKVGFDDGSTAEQQTVWFRKMLNNKRYLLFLRDESKTDGFLTTGGPQGVFELPADGHGAISHSGLRDDPMRQYDNKDIVAFLKEIKQLSKGK